MRVGFLTGWLSRASGGVTYCVSRLARELSRRPDLEALVFGSIDPKYPDDWQDWPEPVFAHRIFGPAWFAWAPGSYDALRSQAPDVVDAQGLWVYPSYASLAYARHTKKPYVITPHGMLDPWTIRHSWWKKQLVRICFEAEHLARASCLRATADTEVRHLRSYGLKNPIAVVPNGVDVPTRSLGNVRASKRLLFLSRLHPKKGIDSLLRAWARVHEVHSGWELVIAGPDEVGHRAKMQRLAAELGASNVIWHAPVEGEEKSALYRSADLFVLPTHAENFGLVVAEALAHEVPVITTKNAPWHGLERHNCGWWIEFSDEALTASLDDAMSLADAQRRVMGSRGCAWMRRDFCWPAIANQMHEVYTWVLGGGPPPSCVVTD